MLRSLLREPLTHFLGLSIAIFALFHFAGGGEEPRDDDIVVTAARIEQLSGLFAKTWQRSPSTDELKALIDEHVKEEIYYREALLLGLDKDDTVIRRRLRQKMEFLAEDMIGSLTPTDNELDAYLKNHPDRFRIETMHAFQQVYLSPDLRGSSIAQDAQLMLDRLRADPDQDPATLGDQTLLPAAMPLTASAAIGRTFGGAFASAIERLRTGQWEGPTESTYGLHLVRITERREGRNPALSEVRDGVAREWASDKRKSLEQQRADALLARYKVTIQPSPAAEVRR
jgi:hypothetical protein